MPRLLVGLAGTLLALAAGGRGARQQARPNSVSHATAPSRAARVAASATPRSSGHAALVRRLLTARGAVHVVAPRDLHSDGAAVVIYVHGYRSSADTVMRAGALARSFIESRANALLIVPDSPRHKNAALNWADLSQLVALAARGVGIEMPDGPIVALAHSGGYRSVAAWTRDSRLRCVVLLDGLYGAVETFERWLRRASRHRLVAFGAGTHARAVRWARRRRGAVVLQRAPRAGDALGYKLRRAPLVVLRSRLSHAALGRTRQVFDVALALGQLEPLGPPRSWR